MRDQQKLKSPVLLLASLVIFLMGCGNRTLFAQENSADDQASLAPSVQGFTVDPIPGLVLHEKEVRAGLLYDTERKAIVWEKDMHYAYPIASLTKMMVALLATEDVRAGKTDWSDEVKVERLYKKSPRSKSTYKTTETYTLESLVQLAMIPSNNQACADIAQYLGGDVATFVQRMNNRAHELGMNNTFYSNPSGLPAAVREADNSASPHDLLLLALEMIRFEEILKITSIGYAEITNDKRSGIFRNHNHLVIDYENEVDGLKTGFTKRARFCLVATSKREGHRLISIVLGVDGPYLRNEIVASMLNNYYERIGCGSMIPTAGGPVAKKVLTSDPAENMVAAADNSNAVYQTVWIKQKKTHVVKKGETLSEIAKRYSSTYQQIRKWNGISGDRINAGQKLLVFVNVPKKIMVPNNNLPDNEDETTPQQDDGALQVTQNNSDAGSGNDTTTEGEKTVVKNNSKPQNSSSSNPASAKAAPTVQQKQIPAIKYVYHTVQPGDTLWSIAKKYDGISADDIKRMNKIHDARDLRPGTRLKVKMVTGS